ncbi:MAG: ATP-binding protein [Pseudomonadota bacterium]
MDWLLVNQQRASEAFSSLKRAKTITIVVILIVVLCIAANAFRLTKKMVTRIEEADKKKEKMNEQVFQTKKLASIGELAIGVAHEINNPVAVMVEKAGWIEDLLEEEEFQKSKNLDEFKGALKQIKTQGKRCGDINYKLLSFARKTGSKREKVRLNELIEDSIAVARKRADLSNVEVSANIQNDLPPMEVPQTELQRVLLNLITNALDAMQDTGGTLSISAQLENENIVIDVSDNGPGIPEENLSRIFDPFFTTKPFGEGTGLGLSICYGIIKELGGDISVKSEIETGTTFRVILPLSRDRPAKAEGGFETRDSYE